MSPEVKPLARKNDVVVQEFVDELLIYDLDVNKAYALNQTALKVWQHCNGKNTISDISEKLSIELQEFVSEELILLTLQKLKKEKLIFDFEIQSPFEGLSRREVIRKIGLASMVAFPLVSTITAPLAVHAQSGCSTGTSGRALNCPCTAISQCQPPASRCCLNSPGAPGNQTCVVAATQISNGGLCGNSCSCISNCCAGGLCVSSMVIAPGGICTIACQCSSGSCNPANMCA